MSLTETFEQFVETSWEADKAYELSDFVQLFGCNRGTVYHHLMMQVRKGNLCKVKYDGEVYYMLWYWKPVFDRFKWIGVETL